MKRIILLIPFLFLFTGCSYIGNVDILEDKDIIQAAEVIEIQSDSDDQNAFELLQEYTEVEYEQYDFGILITSINGLKANSDHFWSLYVNDEVSMIGVDQTILNNGDKMTWKYEKISETNS